jgi:hypothetical protein
MVLNRFRSFRRSFVSGRPCRALPGILRTEESVTSPFLFSNRFKVERSIMGSVAWINDVGRNWLLRSLPRVLDDHIPISIGWTKNPSSTAFTVCAGPGVRRMELIVLKREHILSRKPPAKRARFRFTIRGSGFCFPKIGMYFMNIYIIGYRYALRKARLIRQIAVLQSFSR